MQAAFIIVHYPAVCKIELAPNEGQVEAQPVLSDV
jgi:hypothetical protein